MSCFPSEQDVFQCLCKVYGSSAAFSEIAEQNHLFPDGSTSAETWLRKTTKDSILVTEDKKGKITEVHAFSTHARLCLDYTYTGKCDNHDCTCLHICRDYMTNSCSRGVTCRLNHHFHNERDRGFLSKVNFVEFTDLQLQMLVLSSTPQICVKYNTAGKCNRGDSCTKIHICHGHLRKCCSGDKCGLLHETAMDTDHTTAVLKRLMLNNVDKHEVMKMILDNEHSLLSDNEKTMVNNADKPEAMEMIQDNKPSLSENVTTKCHTHQDKPDTPICPHFLIGTCDEGSTCTELHCSMPYQWQYKVSLFEEWKCFTDEDNLALEKMFCDVNARTLMNFKPAQPPDLSCLKRQGRLLGDLEYEITIDLDNMTIAFQKPRSGEELLAGLLRRLSTLSHFTRPYETMLMTRKWYWKNGNVRHIYDKDFSTQVKRRPEKPISYEDLDGWARGDSTAKKKKVEERPVKTYFPSQISSSVQPDVPYQRVPLDAASVEFQDVENLFKRSMNDLAVIRNIDRVQNPLMWEEYCRNRCKMRRKTEVNEKRLFHGTSPQNVRAMCEKNFDPRIHKNNGRLTLGQGTYFAVDAVSSHSYMKTESDLFQYMFLAKVLVGSYTKGHPSYQRPPAKNFPNDDTHLYDSCVDNISNPTIFVVFDRNHFFPEYVIQYLVEQPPSAGTLLLKNVPTPSSSTQSSSSASAVSNTELTDTTPSTSSDSLDTASLPSASATQNSFPASVVSNTELNDTTLTRHSDSLDIASLPHDSATQSNYSASEVSNAELTDTTPARSSDSHDTASLPRDSATQSSYSASEGSNAELTDTTPTRSSDNLDTASLLNGSATQSSYSASVVSNAELTGTTPTRNSDHLDTASLPSGSATQSSYSAAAVSNAGLTSTNTTRSSDNLDTASFLSGSATQSSYSVSTVSNTELTGTSVSSSPDSLGTASFPSGYNAESGYSASTVSSAELTGTASTKCPTSTKGGTGAEVHSHEDKPDASSICSQFLIGTCDEGLACTQLHYSLPYQWQYKVSLFDEWKCFTDEDNLALEKMYCDVNVETIVNFKPAQPLDLSRLKRQGRFPGDLEYEITIDLDNMTIAFQRPWGGEGLLAGLLRRLSTVSYVTRPYESMFTKWKWYWKDNGNIWHLHDKDCLKKDLQKKIEQAYQDMLWQDKTKAMYQFVTSENVYNLFFDSTREMYQVNVRTGTQRQVKRRPEKPISDDDLNEGACGDSTSERNTTEERPVTTTIPSHVPTHRSSMRPNVPYTRAALDTASAEFQEVAKLFKQSMNGRAVIEKIDRVHNPLIWEEYSRNKYKMMLKAHLLSEEQVYEKKLFHGTSPENVGAICEKNFDPRVHSRNKMLKLGKGTYFAVNALYSHGYAKRDSDLLQYMFLAKVLVGSYTKGHPSYRRPPAKDLTNVDIHLYDSCVDNVSNPTIYVVFDRNHFYPEYVIQYLAAQRVPRLPLLLKKRLVQRLISSSSTQSSSSALAVSNLGRFAPLCQYGALKPRSQKMPMAPRNEHGILKQASLPSGFATQSGCSAAAVSNEELTGTTPTRSSGNLDTASLPSGSATQSSYSAAAVCNAEPTGTNPTRSSDNLDTASLPSDFATQSHTHQDNPDKSICPQFLIGRCGKGSACTELHYSLPFQWQYKVSLFDEWNCFIDEDNLALEKMYCDVNVGTIVNFKLAGSLDPSRLNGQGRFPGDLEYEITIDLDNMTIAFQRPRGGEGLLAGLLRRLSTVSYVTWPYESMFTNWKWYWKDNDNNWQLYDKDFLERDLQKKIEKSYQDMLRQGKTKAMCRFLTRSKNIFNLFFDSTREMYQVNVITGTQREVKRRPEKPISDDDLNEWACGDSTSERNITEERPVTSNIPSHWSSMRPNVTYTRVALDATSAEFREVEKLFKRSMNVRVVIDNIDRVQNPLILEEYCRNKEKMTRKAHLLYQQRVNEKKLFHGTSPENVEAICEKNFDPRLHRKNKRLELGQGTYFAVNAVCSHAYAKRDCDLFQYMFLTKVLVGCHTKGHPSYRGPPLKDFGNVGIHLYDSCVDEIANPTIFVVFDTNHFYPEYIIKYSSVCEPL